MKITLQVNGREMTFSEKELSDILKEYFSKKTTQKVPIIKEVQKPTEEKYFEVNPQSIDQSLFEKQRIDFNQEEKRQLILEAFARVKECPDRYGKNFKTLMPKKEWSVKTCGQLKQMAKERGDHCADWSEQALEWAQRIQNGETWEEICNYPDKANCYRLIIWKDGKARLVGGSVNFNNLNYPASRVNNNSCDDFIYLNNTVPLVVSY